jgi:hypothetical protein
LVTQATTVPSDFSANELDTDPAMATTPVSPAGTLR